jgi:hypothetical protein
MHILVSNFAFKRINLRNVTTRLNATTLRRLPTRRGTTDSSSSARVKPRWRRYGGDGLCKLNAVDPDPWLERHLVSTLEPIPWFQSLLTDSTCTPTPWAAVEAAENAQRNASSSSSSPSPSSSRIAGYVLTLVPTWGEERRKSYEAMSRAAERVYGGLEGALAKNPKDCAVGFGCISFAKHVASKGSNAPSLDKLRALKGRLPPVMILANRAAHGHPAENGKAAATALGADFHSVDTFEEAAATWPALIADFVAKVAAAEGLILAADLAGTLVPTVGAAAAAAASASSSSSSSSAGAGVFSDLADGLTLTREVGPLLTSCTRLTHGLKKGGRF